MGRARPRSLPHHVSLPARRRDRRRGVDDGPGLGNGRAGAAGSRSHDRGRARRAPLGSGSRWLRHRDRPRPVGGALSAGTLAARTSAMRLKHPVVHGHPLHAMLSDLPAALIPTALLAACAERARPRRETRFAAASATALALTSGIAASVVGWWDWRTMPKDHP